MQPVIPPTIGRRVLFFSAGTAGVNDPKVPFDAGIAYVWGDADPVKNAINISYANHSGIACNATSVLLYDRAQNAEDAHGRENYAVWMPYQFEQALRAVVKVGEQAQGAAAKVGG